MHTVAVIAGSLRRESIDLRFAKALAETAEPTLAFKLARLGNVPPHNEDRWARPPEGVTRLKRGIDHADAALFVTPARSQLRGMLVGCGVRVASQPEVCVQTQPGPIGDDVTVTDEKICGVLAGFIAKFAVHIQR